MPKPEQLKKSAERRKKNAPLAIPTRLRKAKIAIAIVAAVIAVVAAGIAVWAFVLPHNANSDGADKQSVDLGSLITREETAQDGDGGDIQQEESRYTVDQANAAISDYYRLLSAKDASGLAQAGFAQASAAASLGWLDRMSYRVDADVQPDASAFPASVSMYAGNYVYKISDFFSSAPDKKVHSNITGDTGYEGWIYYNRQTNRWVVVDPTIPTATSAPESNAVTRTSSDGKVTTKMTSDGALSNPWWSVADIRVEISSSSTEYAVSVAQRYIDDGVSVQVPGELTAGVSQVGGAGVSDANGQEASTQSKAEGTCRVVRGVTSGFGLERIGAQAQAMDGNIAPVDIQTPNENITPLYAMGAAQAADLGAAEAAAQVEEYGATGEVAPLEREEGGEAEGGAE